MNPIIQKLENKLHKQRPAVLKQQAVDAAPTTQGQGGNSALALGTDSQ